MGKVVAVYCRVSTRKQDTRSQVNDLQRLGVGLVSLKEGLDLSTAAGRLMANVLASVAQFETELRAERIIAGQAAACNARVKKRSARGSTPCADQVQTCSIRS